MIFNKNKKIICNPRAQVLLYKLKKLINGEIKKELKKDKMTPDHYQVSFYVTDILTILEYIDYLEERVNRL